MPVVDVCRATAHENHAAWRISRLLMVRALGSRPARPHREIFPVATPSRDFTVDDTSAPFVYRIPEARDARTERERV